MQFSAAQIAKMIDGRVDGHAETAVTSFGKIEEAKAGQLAFLANPKYEEYLYTTNASIIIVNETQELKQPVSATLIRVPNAYAAFATLLEKYEHLVSQQLKGIQQPAYIDATAKMGDNVFIGAFAYLGQHVIVADGAKIYPQVFLGNNVHVGENTIIHPGVKIYHNCTVGKNVVIHSGTVIGSDGFGFAPQGDGKFIKVPQIGNVVIEDDVEIGANTTIDRATIGSTLIKSGAKLDNLLQIGHNVEVGKNTVIAALTGVSGSTKIGNNVIIGGQAGLAGHIQIADGTKINGKSGVSKSVKTPNTSITGTPAVDFLTSMRSQAISRNLPALEKRVKDLEELVKKIFETKTI
jgi:UDP-3-O-[3-hydroxymyristoyl] glucosamine N-acyltransferase